MIICKNSPIELSFDEVKGTLVSLKNDGCEFVKIPTDIFKLSYRDQAGTRHILCASEMRAEKATQSEHAFSCTYVSGKISVTIGCTIEEEAHWQISADVPAVFGCEWVKYPQIVVNRDFAERGGNAKLLWGLNEGVLIDDIARREECIAYGEPTYPSKGLYGVYPAAVETQFMAYYNDDGGLYFAAHDAQDHVKGISFYPFGEDGVMLEFMHFCGVNFGETYTMAYPMVMRFFHGDWYDAAEIYRSWFEAQGRTEFVPIAENPHLPDWYGESPIIVTYPVRGLHDMDEMTPNKLYPYMNAMPHIERLEKELNSKIMVILMHWEGTAPWAPPYVWPPFGGEAELQKFIDALHARGDVIGVYCSGLGWTEQSNLVAEYNKKDEFDEKGLARYMCLSPEQDLPYSNICREQRSGYDMCPSQRFTAEVLKNEVSHIAASGIDYIQLLDQNHGGNAYFCYSREHGHPPVPGKWQTDAVKKLLAEVSGTADKSVLFGCESAAAEAFIPQLLFSDNRYNINFGIGIPVPAYAYVFHKYVNNFMGNQVSTHFHHDRSPENLNLRIAHSFIAGDMLTLVINQDGEIIWNWGTRFASLPDQQKTKNFVKSLNAWRRGMGEKYLHIGQMQKPYAVDCPKRILYLNNGREIAVEEILTSAWGTKAGEYGQFLVNYTDAPVQCVVTLPEQTHMLYTDANATPTELRGGACTIEIAPRSAILIERK